jgi:serpin B
VIDHPDAWLLVKQGAAEAADEECEARVGMTSAQLAAARARLLDPGSLLQRLDTALYGQISRAVATGETRGEVVLPKFTLTASRALSSALSAMGMSRAFSDQAEFPRLFPSVATKIGFVQHAVAVTVEERGTRAAAVTAVGIVPVSMPAGVVVNRPFIFLIRERLTGAILFAGVVRDPRPPQ